MFRFTISIQPEDFTFIIVSKKLSTLNYGSLGHESFPTVATDRYAFLIFWKTPTVDTSDYLGTNESFDEHATSARVRHQFFHDRFILSVVKTKLLIAFSCGFVLYNLELRIYGP